MEKVRIFDALGLSLKLLEGSAALFPSDTLPALGAKPDHAYKLWDIKQRPLHKPFILMGASQKELFKCISSVALEDAELIANRYWPGALTMILPAAGSIVNKLNPGKLNIGIRIPACDVALDLLSKSGPLATTSANLSGEKPCIDAIEAENAFPDLPLLGPIPWPKSSGLASTVIVWHGPDHWELVRSGAVLPVGID